MILKQKKVSVSESAKSQTISIEIPNQSIPLTFIKQGTKGVFFWYLQSNLDSKETRKYFIASKEIDVPYGAIPFGTLKLGSYMQVFEVD